MSNLLREIERMMQEAEKVKADTITLQESLFLLYKKAKEERHV